MEPLEPWLELSDQSPGAALGWLRGPCVQPKHVASTAPVTGWRAEQVNGTEGESHTAPALTLQTGPCTMGQRPVVQPRGAPQGQDRVCRVPAGLLPLWGSNFTSQQPWAGQMKRWRLPAPALLGQLLPSLQLGVRAEGRVGSKADRAGEQRSQHCSQWFTGGRAAQGIWHHTALGTCI